MKKASKKQMAAIKKAINEAKRMFKRDGILPTRLPHVACFVPGGSAPKSKAEWMKRKKQNSERYRNDISKVRSWFDWLGKQMGGNVDPSLCFKHLEAAADVGTVEDANGGRINEEAEPGVSFPIFVAGGRKRVKDWKEGYHWHVVRYKNGYFVSDCWGGMFSSKSLYHVILWSWVQTIDAENENYQKTYADAEVIG
jgi:hypothetical protein